MTKLILTGPTPVASRVGRGFVPVIYHPNDDPERFPRKAKATPAEAIEYARRTIHYRRVRANEKGRRIEALEHPRFATWAEYKAATPEQPRASWDAILAYWQRNYEREFDADFAFDHGRERLELWGSGQ